METALLEPLTTEFAGPCQLYQTQWQRLQGAWPCSTLPITLLFPSSIYCTSGNFTERKNKSLYCRLILVFMAAKHGRAKETALHGWRQLLSSPDLQQIVQKRAKNSVTHPIVHHYTGTENVYIRVQAINSFRYQDWKCKAAWSINRAADLCRAHVMKTSWNLQEVQPTEFMYMIPCVRNISWDFSCIQTLGILIIMWRFS